MVWNDPNNKTVSGIFNSERKIEELLAALEKRNIGRDLINTMMSDETRDHFTNLEKDNKMPEGASIGGVSGGLLGGLIGGLAMAGGLLIPGINLLVVGPLAGALVGGAAGVVTGGLIGALVGLGIPEYEAKAYEQHLKEAGNVLVIAHVHVEGVPGILDLFKHYGGQHVVVQVDTGVTARASGHRY
jgi:hypothetical protein